MPRAASVVHWAIPMQQLNLKPTHKLVTNYYDALGRVYRRTYTRGME